MGITLTFTTSGRNSTAASSQYTFSNVPVGEGGPNRSVFVGSMGRNGGSISSITVDGNSANSLVGAASGDAASYAAIFGVALTSSSSLATIVVNWTGTSARCAIGVWAAESAATVASTSGFDTTDPFQTTLNVGDGGAILGAAFEPNGSVVTSFTWTAPLTEDLDTAMASQTYSFGSGTFTAAQASTCTANAGAAVAGQGVGVFAAVAATDLLRFVSYPDMALSDTKVVSY